MKKQSDEIIRISELTRKAYNLAAQKYHDLFKDEMNEKEYDRKLLDSFALSFSNNSKILDAGCGPSGHIGRCLSDKGLDVTGIDISDKCIEIASAYNPQMRFERMDLINMTYQNNSFDGIISFYSIIHTPKQFMKQIFSEFARVLKPKGKLLVVVKKGEKEEVLNKFLGYDAQIHFTHFVEDEIRNYIKNSGLKLLSLETRKPYNEEIEVDRIYSIAEKPN